MSKEWTKATIAKTIDHTLLKAIATEQQVRELCVEAKANGFFPWRRRLHEAVYAALGLVLDA